MIAAALPLAVALALGPVPVQDAPRGVASWYRAPSGTAAAGPALRRYLGRNWRGTVVRVTANGHSVRVRLTDWMAHPTRAVDLNSDAFRRTCGPLWLGVCRVRITRA